MSRCPRLRAPRLRAHRPLRARPIRAAATAVAIAALAAGCTGGATNAPNPGTSAQSASAAPSGPVTASRVIDRLSDDKYAASATIEGTITVGEQEADATGELYMAGADEKGKMTLSMNGESTTTEWIKVDGKRYRKQDDEAWETLSRASEGGLVAMLRNLELQKKTSKSGTCTFTAANSGDITPGAFAIDDESITDWSAEVVITTNASADVTDLSLEATWTQEIDSTSYDAGATLSYTFKAWKSATITAPTVQPTPKATSKPTATPKPAASWSRFEGDTFTVEYPKGWKAQSINNGELFTGPNDEQAAVTRKPAQITLGLYLEDVQAMFKAQKSGIVLAVNEMTLFGEDAYDVQFSYESDRGSLIAGHYVFTVVNVTGTSEFVHVEYTEANPTNFRIDVIEHMLATLTLL